MTFPPEYIAGIKLEINGPLNIHGHGVRGSPFSLSLSLCPGSLETSVEKAVSAIETGRARVHRRYTKTVRQMDFHRDDGHVSSRARALEFNVARYDT